MHGFEACRLCYASGALAICTAWLGGIGYAYAYACRQWICFYAMLGLCYAMHGLDMLVCYASGALAIYGLEAMAICVFEACRQCLACAYRRA